MGAVVPLLVIIAGRAVPEGTATFLPVPAGHVHEYAEPALVVPNIRSLVETVTPVIPTTVGVACPQTLRE